MSVRIANFEHVCLEIDAGAILFNFDGFSDEPLASMTLKCEHCGVVKIEGVIFFGGMGGQRSVLFTLEYISRMLLKSFFENLHCLANVDSSTVIAGYFVDYLGT